MAKVKQESPFRRWRGGIAGVAGVAAACTFLASYCFGYLFRNPFALITIPLLFFTMAFLYAVAIIVGLGWSAKSGRDVWKALLCGAGLCVFTIFVAHWLSVMLWHQEPINPMMYFLDRG